MTSSATARRRSRPTSAAICTRHRTRAATSTPTRRSGCRRLPAARGRTTTATSTLTATCSTANRRDNRRRPADRHLRRLAGLRTSGAPGRSRRSIRRSSRLGRAARTTGSSACRCSRRSCRGCRSRPAITAAGGRSYDHGRRHRQPAGQRVRGVHAVQRDGARRRAPAQRRRLPGPEPVQHHPAGSLAAPRTCRRAANYYGDYTRHWDGFDITAQARLATA